MCLACLASMLLAHLVVNLVWLRQDQTMRGYDMGVHIACITNGYNHLVRDGLEGLAVVARGESPYNWPSAGFLPWIALSLIFGPEVDTLCAFNLAFLALLLASVFAIGRRLWSRRAGLMAAALVGCYPIVHGESRVVGIDLPGAALVTLCVALLLHTERLRRTGPCLLFGLCLGAATLVRPHVHFSLTAPLALLLVLALVRPGGGRGRLRVLANVALLGVVSAAVSAVWWFGRLQEIFGTFTEHVEGMSSPPIPMESSSSPAYYILGATDYLDGALVIPLLVGGVALLVAQLRGLRHGRPAAGQGEDAGVIWAWILGGTLVYIFITAHHYRYLLSVTPALALVTAAGILSLPRGRLRALLVAGVLAAGALVWLLGSFLEHGTPSTGGGPAFTRLVGGRAPTGGVASAAPLEPDVSVVSRYSWGPPDTDVWVRTIDQAATAMAGRHLDNDAVMVRMVQVAADTQSRMELDLKFQWLAQPILAARMPGIRVTRDFFLSANDLNDNGLLDTSIPYLRSSVPVRHCYSMRIFKPRNPPPPRSPECHLVFDGALHPGVTGSMRVSVFHYPSCQNFLCETDGEDPKGILHQNAPPPPGPGPKPPPGSTPHP